MEKSQHIDFNEDTTNKSTGTAWTAVKAGYSEFEKKINASKVYTKKDFAGFVDTKKMGGFLTKLE